MSMKWNAIGVLLSLLTVGCGLDFDEVHKVEYLRVLAVQAEPPEISPGEGTTVSVLWADPKGEGRDVEFVWWVCAGFVFGAELDMCHLVVDPVRIDRISSTMSPPERSEISDQSSSSSKCSIW